MDTTQEEKWKTTFGKEYTDRNILSSKELDGRYFKNYGISRTQINYSFIGDMKNSKILEVGCNVGNQLLLLKEMEFNDLWGVDVQEYAVEIAKHRMQGVNIIKSSGFNIPFKTGLFDLVFTSGLLIHIAPNDINLVLDEIYRCSNKYIFGFEYCNETNYQEVEYRGNNDFMWKTDFAKLFLSRFSNLKLVQMKKYKYVNNNQNIDIAYLLEKVSK